MLSYVRSVSFGVLGDDDIVAQSSCVVKFSALAINDAGTVYDRRMGCVDDSTTCVTCGNDQWNCPGHFGHIELATPVIIFPKTCLQLLRCFCLKCCRLLCDRQAARTNSDATFDARIRYVATRTFCAHCRDVHPTIKYNAVDNVFTASHKLKESLAAAAAATTTGISQASMELTPARIKAVFDGIDSDDCDALCIDATLFHPRNLVLTKFPVAPPCCRPRYVTPTNCSDDDLSLMLADLVKCNNVLVKGVANETNVKKNVIDVRKIALAICDNSRGLVTHNSNHNPMVGIMERIGKKRGLIRSSMMGKRCNNTARTVVGPDPTLRLDEIGVPRRIAATLTVPEYVTTYNVDELTRRVNADGADFATSIVRANGDEINVQKLKTDRGTPLQHGDRVVDVESGETLYVVTDCYRTPAAMTNAVAVGRRLQVVAASSGDVVGYRPPSNRGIALNVGDKLNRHLRDGDLLLVNRQPTLHRNSMLAFHARLLGGRTFRLNLAVTAGFNMDFDGDECNVWVLQTLDSLAEMATLVKASRNILSTQSSKSEMVIVQDSLLAAYKMTARATPMRRDDFYACLMTTSAFERYADVDARLREAMRARGDTIPYAHTLFAFILPDDMSVDYDHLRIVGGVVVAGYFDKTTLKGGHDSVIRLLCLEYGNDVAARFVDDIQFLTNAWLQLNPFSVLLEDCFPSRTSEIKEIVERFYAEADTVAASTSNASIRERRLTLALNKPRDVGMRLAKEALGADNNFVATVESGSKGDYFNIAQISGLLGQQNVAGARIVPTLTNGTRTSVHYPRVITTTHEKYESRGFIGASFIGGLNPMQMFFHAMSGREGMTSTALNTGQSGYMQRSCVKLNEDLKICYDGTVRDSEGIIYQFVYGNHGFDPARVRFLSDGSVRAVDVQRLARRLSFRRPSCSFSTTKVDNDDDDKHALESERVDFIVDCCRPTRATTVPSEIFDAVWRRHANRLRADLSSVRLVESARDEFTRRVIDLFHRAFATPGEAVGIVCALSIGEKQTQANLNVFHTAGKFRETQLRLEDVVKLSKIAPANRCCKVYFNRRFASSVELRRIVGGSLRSATLSQLIDNGGSGCIDDITRDDDDNGIICRLNYEFAPKVMFAFRANPVSVARRLADAIASNVALRRAVASNATTTVEATAFGLIVTVKKTNTLSAVNGVANLAAATTSNKRKRAASTGKSKASIGGTTAAAFCATTFRRLLETSRVCGIEGIRAAHAVNDRGEWYVITEGSNVRELLAHPLVDGSRLKCNDIWEVYSSLGLGAVRRSMFDAIKTIVPGVNDTHVLLLIDQMMIRGRPMSVTRYTNRTAHIGPLSKATFEESGSVLTAAAVRAEIDPLRAVSSALMFAKRPQLGTGLMDVRIDVDALVRGGGGNGRHS